MKRIFFYLSVIGFSLSSCSDHAPPYGHSDDGASCADTHATTLPYTSPLSRSPADDQIDIMLETKEANQQHEPDTFVMDNGDTILLIDGDYNLPFPEFEK